MRVENTGTTIVITGAWNPAILSPEWLARQIFKKAAGENVPLQVEFGPAIGIAPRFIMEGLVIIPGHDKLVIGIPTITAENLTKAESFAAEVLKTLPHTPISAFGENFQFVDESPSQQHLSIFTQANDLAGQLDFPFELASQTVAASLKVEQHLINLNRTFTRGKVIVEFNFHYDSPNATEVISRITNSFWRNYGVACEILRSLYGENLLEREEPVNA